MSVCGPLDIERKVSIRINAALVTQPSGASDTLDHRGASRSGVVVGLADASDDEHLVVHGEAEQEGEHHQRHPHGDRTRCGNAPQCSRCRGPAAR